MVQYTSNQLIMDGLYVNYSEAAREGDLTALKGCPRKDVNRRDFDGMTPVQWAAAYGNLEALRILIGKGGNPDKPNNEGMTSIHLAASAGQLHCLVFLTNFGGNIYAMSDSGTTAIQEASNKGHVECVRHLETFIAHQVQQDRLKVEKLQEKSKKDAEKRVKEKSKLLKKLDRDYEKKSVKHRKYGGNPQPQHYNGFQPSASYEINEFNENQKIFASSRLTKITPQSHTTRTHYNENDVLRLEDDLSSTADSFRRAEEDFVTRQSVTSDDISFEQGAFSPNLKRLGVVYLTGQDKLSETTEKTNLTTSTNARSAMAASFHSIPATNGFIHNGVGLLGKPGPTVTLKNGKIVKINQNGYVSNNQGQQLGKSVTNHSIVNGDINLNQNGSSKKTAIQEQMGSLFTFLHALQLDECRETFLEERIDLRACLLCNEEDLREIGLQLGPRKKIVDAIKHRNTELENNHEMNDSAV